MFKPLNFSLSSAGGGEKSSQPRNILQSSKLAFDKLTHSSRRPAQSQPPGSVSFVEEDTIQVDEEHKSSDEYHENGKLELEPETSDLEGDQTDRDTTIVTGVEERTVTTIQKGGQTVVTEQPRRTAITTSRTSGGQLQYAASATLDGAQKKASLQYEARFPAVTDSSFTPISGSEIVENWAMSRPAISSAKQKLLALQRAHEEENNRLVSLLLGEHDDYERLCGEQLAAFQKEKESLLLQLASAASRVSLLEIELTSLRGDNTVTGESGILDSVITTITTDITMITTTITTVTTRIEKWKEGGSGSAHINISYADIQQLASDLSTISSRSVELKERYDELLRSFGAVRRDLQATLSHRDEQGRNIASLTAEVTQWKNADAEKVQQLAALGQDNESLRREIILALSKTSELQKNLDTKTTELVSLHDTVQTQASSIDEKDRMIASLTAEVGRWRQSDANKADQLATARQEYDKSQRELSASSSKFDYLQKRYDAQSKELSSVRGELQTAKASAEERGRKVTTLTVEVDKLEQASAAMKERFNEEHTAKEKLVEDLAAFSAQTTDLKKRFETQSGDLVSVRKQLQEKISLLEEKEHVITSLETDVSHAESEITMKTEQITTAKAVVERIRGELSVSSSRVAELQKRCETQSQEISTLHDELHRITTLISEGASSVDGEVPQEILDVLEKKNKEMEVLRGDLAAATSRNTELQKSYEALTTEVSVVRDELKVKTSQYERTISSLNAQVEQWKRTHNAKADQLTVALEHAEKIQGDLSLSTSRLAEFQSRCEAQLRDIVELRNKIQASVSLNEAKDLTIASLTAEIDQWKLSDAAKSEKITAALQQVDELTANSSASVSQIAQLEAQLEAQSLELTTVREKLRIEISHHEEKEHTITSLNAEVERLKSGDVANVQKIATMVEQIKKLQQGLSNTASRLAGFESDYGTQAEKLASVRTELQTKTLSDEEKGRKVAALTAQVEEWKRTDAGKDERILVTSKRCDDLQRELTNSGAKLAELQKRYDERLKELEALHIQLSGEESESSSVITTLRSQIESLESSIAVKTNEVTTAQKNLAQLRHDLASISDSDAIKAKELVTVRENIDQLRRELDIASSQIESWKSSDASKKEELIAARKDVDQLRRDLESASSKISIFQQQSTESTTLIERLRNSEAAKTEELATARRDLGQLRRDLASSSSQIVELQNRLTVITSQIERLKSSVVTKTEELASAREDLVKLGRDLSTSSSQNIEWQQRYNMQLVELTKRTEELADAHNKFEQLEDDLSTSSSRFSKLQELYDAQSAELGSLQVQLEAISSAGGDKDQIVVALNTQIETLKSTNAERAKKLSTLSSRNEELKAQLDALSQSSSIIVSEETKEFHGKVIMTQVKDYAAVIKLSATVDEWFRDDNDRVAKLVREVEARNREKEELRRKVDILREIYIRSPELKQIFQSDTVEVRRQSEAATTVQVEERQAPLDSVKRFVNTADTYSDSAISQELQKLNAEVQKNAIFMAERIAENFHARTTKVTTEQASAAQRVSEVIGQTLTDCLGSDDDEEVALYLPIAFQAYLTYYLRELISSWTIERGYNDLIDKTYERLQKSEVQTVSGRWRSLTRAYISPSSTSDSKKLFSDAVAGFSDIVVAASCATSLSDAKTMLSKFEDKLASILAIASGFSKLIGEVVSADFEVLAIRPVETFDETTMEEETDDDRGAGAPGALNGEKVLCSTQLGMTKRMQLGSGEKDTLTVTKAKVVLESFVDE